MKKLLKRVGTLLFLLIWVSVVAFPYFAFRIATNNEIQIGNSEGANLRVFSVTERESAGLGWQYSGGISDEGCQKVTLRYTLWDGEATGNSYCRCENIGRIEPENGRCSLP